MMGSREAAIVVNDDEISFQEYQRTYDQFLSVYRQQFGGSIPEELLVSLGISNQVKSQLIREVLFRQGASAMGLFVSAPEIQQEVRSMPQFQEDNAFNMAKYKDILAANRLTPRKYEASRRIEMLGAKGFQAIGDFATTVTDAEIKDIYQQAKEEISLEFIKISPETFVDDVSINEKALQTWFGKNKDNYKTAPQVQLKFLSFPYVGDGAPENMAEEKARPLVFQKANEAYEGIIAAGSLQEFAKNHPETVIRKTDFFSRETVPDNLDKAAIVLNKAFTLKKGELSSLIESPNGYSILFAQDIKDPEVPPFDTVRDQVTNDYKKAQSKILAREKGEEILSTLKEHSSFADIGEQNGIEIKQTKLSRSSGAETNNTFPTSLLMNVFSLSSSKPLPEEPAQVGEDYYIYHFTGRMLPDPINITEQEKAQYSGQILNAKRERIVQAWIRHQENNAEIFTSKNL